MSHRLRHSVTATQRDEDGSADCLVSKLPDLEVADPSTPAGGSSGGRRLASPSPQGPPAKPGSGPCPPACPLPVPPLRPPARPVGPSCPPLTETPVILRGPPQGPGDVLQPAHLCSLLHNPTTGTTSAPVPAPPCLSVGHTGPGGSHECFQDFLSHSLLSWDSGDTKVGSVVPAPQVPEAALGFPRHFPRPIATRTPPGTAVLLGPAARCSARH